MTFCKEIYAVIIIAFQRSISRENIFYGRISLWSKLLQKLLVQRQHWQGIWNIDCHALQLEMRTSRHQPFHESFFEKALIARFMNVHYFTRCLRRVWH